MKCNFQIPRETSQNYVILEFLIKKVQNAEATKIKNYEILKKARKSEIQELLNSM